MLSEGQCCSYSSYCYISCELVTEYCRDLFPTNGKTPVLFLYISLVVVKTWTTIDQSPYCQYYQKFWRRQQTPNYSSI